MNSSHEMTPLYCSSAHVSVASESANQTRQPQRRRSNTAATLVYTKQHILHHSIHQRPLLQHRHFVITLLVLQRR